MDKQEYYDRFKEQVNKISKATFKCPFCHTEQDFKSRVMEQLSVVDSESIYKYALRCHHCKSITSISFVDYERAKNNNEMYTNENIENMELRDYYEPSFIEFD